MNYPSVYCFRVNQKYMVSICAIDEEEALDGVVENFKKITNQYYDQLADIVCITKLSTQVLGAWRCAYIG